MPKYTLVLFVSLAFLLTAGCGGAPAPKEEAAAADETAPASEAAAVEPAPADEAAETAEAAEETADTEMEAVPAEETVQITLVTLVNGLKLEGLLTQESGSEIVLRTEVGEITLSRSRIKTISSKDLPAGVADPAKKKRMRD